MYRQGPRPNCTGKTPSPLGLEHWPNSAVHVPILVEFITSIRTHLKDRSKPNNHNESVLVGSAIAQGTWVLRSPILPWGISPPNSLLGSGNQFQCHYHRSQWSIHLEMIELDPPSTPVMSGGNHNTSTHPML